MKFSDAVDQYVRDMRHAGRINSPRTERSYRDVLYAHLEDIANRDPRTVGREDCKRTLARWSHPNTQRGRRAVLVSFYDWAMEEGIRKDNPARQTRRPRKRPQSVYRLTRTEAANMLNAAVGNTERRAVHLGLCAGLRRDEMRRLQGAHFEREGYVWVSPQIGKGGKERWVPVIAELEPIVDEIRESVGPAEFLFPALVNADPPWNTRQRRDPTRPASSQTIWRAVVRVAERAGIRAQVSPHLLRHFYGDFVARYSGVQIAKAALGHADIKTTQGYLDTTTPEQLSAALGGLQIATGGYPPEIGVESPEWRRRESNPRSDPAGLVSGGLNAWLLEHAARAVRLYAPHFRGLADA